MVLAIKCEVVGLIFSIKRNFLFKYNFAEEIIVFLVWLLVMRQRMFYFQYAMHVA